MGRVAKGQLQRNGPQARNAESAGNQDNLNNSGYTTELRGQFVRTNHELAVPDHELAVPDLFKGGRGM